MFYRRLYLTEEMIKLVKAGCSYFVLWSMRTMLSRPPSLCFSTVAVCKNWEQTAACSPQNRMFVGSCDFVKPLLNSQRAKQSKCSFYFGDKFSVLSLMYSLVFVFVVYQACHGLHHRPLSCLPTKWCDIDRTC